MPFPVQKVLFRFDENVCVGTTLSFDITSTFWGNLEGIWGNPGEIPHAGWEIHGV